MQNTYAMKTTDAVTVREAAEMMNRSRGWVYDKLVTRTFDTVQGDGPVRITLASIREYQEREKAREAARLRPRRKRPALRLVIDNT